jgi:hypothetical protein
MTLNNPRSGAGFVSEYQISALPYVTSSTATSGTLTQIDFPYITSFLGIRNTAASGSLIVGFSRNGTLGTNRLTVDTSGSFGADYRIKSLFVSATTGSVSYELTAGLTLVQTRDFPILTGSLPANPTGSFAYDGIG